MCRPARPREIEASARARAASEHRTDRGGTTEAPAIDAQPNAGHVERVNPRLVPAIGALVLAAACSSSSSETTANPSSASADAGAADAEAPAAVELLAVADLARTGATQALSATWFDPGTRTLFALQDTEPRIVPLAATDGWKTWTPGAPIALTGRPDPTWDGEGLARAGDVFFAVTVETTPLLERFDAAGKYLDRVELPPHFAKQAPGNKGLESLSLSPSGKFLFTANEAALVTDGDVATKTKGTLVRILRRDLATGADAEHGYLTEPLGEGTGGDMGVSDVTAIGDDRVLVLERGYQTGYGNTVRIFVADLSSPPDEKTPVEKRLVVDLATLPSDGVRHPAVQPSPILDNYEALAVGPTLDDGRRVVFVTSDDNASATQVARVLALALRL